MLDYDVRSEELCGISFYMYTIRANTDKIFCWLVYRLNMYKIQLQNSITKKLMNRVNFLYARMILWKSYAYVLT